MTPAERHQAELNRIYRQGREDGANDDPLTDDEIEAIAPLIRPDILLRPRIPKTLPLPAAA